MKKIVVAILLASLHAPLLAQTEKNVESAIKDVTVYQQGVLVSRTARCIIPKGKSTLIFSGLSSKIDTKSIQAKISSGATIVSVTHNIDYLNKNKVSKEVSVLEQNRKVIEDSLKILKSFKTVYYNEREMILSNKSIGGKNGVNVTDLQTAATFFRNRLSEIETKLNLIDRRTYLLRLNMMDIAKQLAELNAQLDMPSSVVKVVVSSEKQMEGNIKLEYIIDEAGWTPNYDVRIKDVDSPLSLTYKAKVFQNTGEEWKDVNMTLSTGNPSISNYKPVLDTYYLTFNNYYRAPSNLRTGAVKPVAGTVTGVVTDAETGEGIPGVTIVDKETSKGTSTDANGLYKIEMTKGVGTLLYSFIGFEGQQQNVRAGSTMNVSLKPSNVKLEEVVVTAYGIETDDKSNSNTRYSISASPKKKEQVPLSIEKQQTATEFKIDIPYTIPSDNQSYDVSMVEYEVPAQYNYSAVPKLSTDAFLMAQVADWTKYNLLSGNANLFFKGVFQGETYLDLTSVEDTLSLSIGRDKDIVIMREIQNDFASKNFVGSSKKELKAWNITVKNNKETPVSISIEDQYPISKLDEIKVEVQEQSGAKADTDSGKLTWKLPLAPKEKKILQLRYSVKYPQGKKVIVD